MAYQLYIYNDSHWVDAKRADDNGALTLIGEFKDKKELDELLTRTNTILCACFKEDDMAYVASNPDIEGAEFVSLTEYHGNDEFEVVENKLKQIPPTIRKYSVDVTRVSYKCITFEVEATSVSEAKAMAFEKAYDTAFEGEDAADYEASDIICQ